MAEPGGDVSPFFRAQRQRLAGAARRGPVLDLACGRGRHTLAAARCAARVVGIDRDRERLAELGRRARTEGLRVGRVCADLETHGIPVRPGSCAVILVFRFLFRPLARAIEAALQPGGLLLYETFSLGQRELGWGPRNPDYLLRPGELPALFPGLRPVECFEGVLGGPRPEAVARLAAIKPR